MEDSPTSFFTAFVLSLVVATTSMTISKAKVFRSLRNFVAKHSNWLGDLIKCPYCTSHYVAVFFTIFYPVKLVERWGWFDYAVTIFVIVALAAFWSSLIALYFEQIDSMAEAGQKGGG